MPDYGKGNSAGRVTEGRQAYLFGTDVPWLFGLIAQQLNATDGLGTSYNDKGKGGKNDNTDGAPKEIKGLVRRGR